MLRSDIIRLFGIRLAISYLLLVLPWPGVGQGFSAIYRGTSNSIFRMIGLEDYVRLDTPAKFHPRGDVEMVLHNPHTGNILRMEYSSRDWAYLSIAASLALIIAVPRPWPTRFSAGGLLLTLTLLFVGLRVAVGAFYGLASLHAFSASDGIRRVAGFVLMSFSATPINSFVIPILLWLLVLYWTYDWQLLRIPVPENEAAWKHSTGAQITSDPRE